MTEFVQALAKRLIHAAEQLPQGRRPLVRVILEEIRDAVTDDPASFVPALELALNDCNLTLTPKGT